MSALGLKQTFRRAIATSALPPKADSGTQSRNVRYVPKADKVRRSKIVLFDHLVGARQQCRWHRKAERLSGLEVDDEFVLGRRLHRKVG